MDMVLPRLIGRFPKTHKTILDELEPSIAAEAFLRFTDFGEYLVVSPVVSCLCCDLVLLRHSDTVAATIRNRSNETLFDAGWNAMLFPVSISAAGIVICVLCGFYVI